VLIGTHCVSFLCLFLQANSTQNEGVIHCNFIGKKKEKKMKCSNLRSFIDLILLFETFLIFGQKDITKFSLLLFLFSFLNYRKFPLFHYSQSFCFHFHFFKLLWLWRWKSPFPSYLYEMLILDLMRYKKEVGKVSLFIYSFSFFLNCTNLE